MNLYFLESDRDLTKKYKLLADGSIEKTSYLNAFEVTSHCEDVSNLTEFADAMKRHAKLGHCLVKGQLNRDLICESRAGSTNGEDQTWWVCFDVDGLPVGTSVDQLLVLMGLSDTSYILQWSASMGIKDESLRCHVMMMLAKPTSASHLKQWLIQLNHETQVLRDNLKLTKTNLSLTWTLDITACQNDKLIYIAAPVLDGLKDPFAKKQRIQLVKKTKDHLVLPLALLATEANKNTTQARVLALRDGANLPKRKLTTKTYKATEVLSKPDEATITEVKTDRGFVYFNLNGGDSWAYWHPEDSPEIIYNFKGEPNYATKELLPEYYAEATANLAKQQRTNTMLGATISAGDKPIYLAFRDDRTSAYYTGTFDPVTEEFKLTRPKTEKMLRDWCAQHDVPIGPNVPVWTLEFDPHDERCLDVNTRWMNTFRRTHYMRTEAPELPVRAAPSLIMTTISHMLGGEQAIISHFINWLACIVQFRDRTGTAWVLYGVEGTGKGTFMNLIMKPLLGHVSIRRGSELAQIYNPYMKNTLMVFIDEAHITAMKDPDGIMGDLRNFITEAAISIRDMRESSVDYPNYTNFVLGSNKPDAAPIPPGDRRWNVGRYQHDKLEFTDAEMEELMDGVHLQDFYHFLMAYPADRNKARTPLVTADRQQLMDTTGNSADAIAAALSPNKGSMEVLLDLLPTDDSYMNNAQRMNQVEAYKEVLHALMLRTDSETGECKIARDELQVIFEYTVGGIPDSPHKFTKYLAHRHLHTEKVRIGKPVNGIKTRFVDFKRFDELDRDHFRQVAAKAVIDKAKQGASK